jgi:DNA-binding response OmpR family regulator
MTTGDATEEPLVMGDIEIEVGARVVTVKGREVDLTRREFDLLVALMRRPNRVISRTELLNAAWPSTYYVEKTVDVHLAGLRKKLGDALRVSSVRGVGYRLEPS